MGAIAGHDTRARLGELAGLPTLVVHGLDDSLIPPDRGRDLARLIPGARLELIPSCGHILDTDAEEADRLRDPHAPRARRRRRARDRLSATGIGPGDRC